MSKLKGKPQKSVEEYRRDIFALKKQLKEQEDRLTELRQKYQNAEVFGDTSYTYGMKLKILEYTLNDIRAKMQKFVGEEEQEYYKLNFSALAFLKSCEVVGLSHQMVFRGVDVDGKGVVGYFQFSTFLKEVMRLDSDFIKPLMNVLSQEESKPVTKERYHQFLASFMIESEQENGKDLTNLQQAIVRVARQLYKQSVQPDSIWSAKELNIAMVIFGLMKTVKNLDVLDCVACYCRCDPLKSGTINASGLVNMLNVRIEQSINFERGAVKFKLSKN